LALRIRFFLAAASLFCAPAAAAEPTNEAPRDRPAPSPDGARRALATGAAVVPGVVVHGSGHYVLGERKTAVKLLVAEGIGLGMVLGGGAGLFATGASRYTVVPFASLSMFGVGVFSASFLADVYGSAASDQDGAWSRARLSPPFFESELGYRYITTQAFDYRDFVVQRFTLWTQRTRFEPSLWSSFAGDNARYHLAVAQRLYGAAPGRPRQLADFVEIELGVTHHRFATEYFDRSGAEALTRARWDLGHVGPTLRGAFVEGSLGYAFNVISYDLPGPDVADDADDLLLATMVFGITLRGPAAAGSEVAVFYDHRHDDFAAGTLMPGLGSGVIGHLGLRGRWFFDERYGFAAEAMYGSAAVVGGSLLIREGK
jgi:hypothetical protein